MDHTALIWVLKMQETSGHLMRGRLRLAECNFDVMCKKGTSKMQADALLRLRILAETIPDDEDDITTFLISDVSQSEIEKENGPPQLKFKKFRNTRKEILFQPQEEADNESEADPDDL